MIAVVLEKKDEIKIRDIDIPEVLGPHDVRISIRNVGICGSDVHYYEYGGIGPFIVRSPMVLGHEAAGVVEAIGAEVTNLAVGDRVCMEPGIPNPNSRASREGMYNLDPSVRFWATPPVHGILRHTVVHPAAYTYRLPEGVSLAEGAMVEPLAVGMQAAFKAAIKPGDTAVVTGAGTIGLLTALAAISGGCSRVILSDVLQPKLDLGETLGPIVPVNASNENLNSRVRELTDGWGADIVFECSGNSRAASAVFEPLCPGGTVVFVGMPPAPIQYDVVAAQAIEATVQHVFRYANVYPRALALMGSGKLDVKPLITDTFKFDDSVAAFDFARHMPAASVKAQILL